MLIRALKYLKILETKQEKSKPSNKCSAGVTKVGSAISNERIKKKKKKKVKYSVEF